MKEREREAEQFGMFVGLGGVQHISHSVGSVTAERLSPRTCPTSTRWSCCHHIFPMTAGPKKGWQPQGTPSFPPPRLTLSSLSLSLYIIPLPPTGPFVSAYLQIIHLVTVICLFGIAVLFFFLLTVFWEDIVKQWIANTVRNNGSKKIFVLFNMILTWSFI